MSKKKESRRQRLREAAAARGQRRSAGMKLLIAVIVFVDLCVLYALFPFASGNANVTLLLLVVAATGIVIVAQLAVAYGKAVAAYRRATGPHGITGDDIVRQMAEDAKGGNRS